jgi:hypothetical protein
MDTQPCDRSGISGVAGNRGFQVWGRVQRARLALLGTYALLVSVGLVACTTQTSDPVTVAMVPVDYPESSLVKAGR